MKQDAQRRTAWHAAPRPRYVAAYWPTHGYVVWDCQQRALADGVYLTRADAVWAAEQRNRAEWKAIIHG